TPKTRTNRRQPHVARRARLIASPSSTLTHRRPPRALAVAGALALSLFGATALAAGKKDAEATELYDKAINEDYIMADIAAAETKLNKAVKLCGADQCSGEVLGKVH